MKHRVLALAASVSLWLCSAARGQTYSTSFDNFTDGTSAESLGIPDVTFAPSPPQSWIIATASDLGFASLTGKMLFQPNTVGTLDVTFKTNVTRCSFVFAMNTTPGNSSLVVTGFSGLTSIGSVTQVTTSAGAFFGEGAINFSPGPAFNRVRVAPSGSNLIAIDNLQAFGALVVVSSPPTGMLQRANTGGGTDSYTLTNLSGVSAAISISQSGSFFSQSPTSFTLGAGVSQVVTIAGLPVPAGAYSGSSIVTGTGLPPGGLSIPIRLLSANPPSGTVNPRPSTNRADFASAAGSTLTGSVTFTNAGNATLTGILVSDVPWLIPQSGIITIPPGGSVTVTFTIDPSQRPDAASPSGTALGTLSLIYLGGPAPSSLGPAGTVPVGGSVTKVSVNHTAQIPVTVQSPVPLGAGEIALFVPGVGHVLGGSGLFLSDLTLADKVGSLNITNLSLYYTPATFVATGGLAPERAPADSQAVQKASLTAIAPNQSLQLADLVKGLFGNESQVGSLQIRLGVPNNLAVNANIFNVSNPAGTYGTTIPIFRSDRALGPGQELYLSGLRGDPPNRTNLYIQETSGQSATVTTTFLDASGNTVASRTDPALGFALLQILSVAPPAAVAARVTNSVSSAGRVLAYATPVDGASGDSWSVVDWNRQSGTTGSAAQLIPAAGAVPGANNTFFRTDVTITNTGTASGSGTLRYYDIFSGAVLDRVISLSPKQTRVLNDVVVSLYGITASSLGYMVFTPASGTFAVNSRTYTATAGLAGTYGTAAPTLPLGSGLRLGQSRRISGLEDAHDTTIGARAPGTFRANYALIETGGAAVTVRVTLLLADGTILGSKDYPLNPNQFLLVQNLARAILGPNRDTAYGDLRNIQAVFEVVGGSGAAQVWVSSVDNGTGDSSLRTE